MSLKIEIDNGSGFCFGVTTAIQKAEEELAKGNTLYCLGDIVHNGMECDRLRQMGLITIDHEQMAQLHDVKVLHVDGNCFLALREDQAYALPGKGRLTYLTQGEAAR